MRWRGGGRCRLGLEVFHSAPAAGGEKGGGNEWERERREGAGGKGEGKGGGGDWGQEGAKVRNRTLVLLLPLLLLTSHPPAIAAVEPRGGMSDRRLQRAGFCRVSANVGPEKSKKRRLLPSRSFGLLRSEIPPRTTSPCCRAAPSPSSSPSDMKQSSLSISEKASIRFVRRIREQAFKTLKEYVPSIRSQGAPEGRAGSSTTGPRIFACVSGGSDSMALLDIIYHLSIRVNVHFHLHVVHFDHRLRGGPSLLIVFTSGPSLHN